MKCNLCVSKNAKKLTVKVKTKDGYDNLGKVYLCDNCIEKYQNNSREVQNIFLASYFRIMNKTKKLIEKYNEEIKNLEGYKYGGQFCWQREKLETVVKDLEEILY